MSLFSKTPNNGRGGRQSRLAFVGLIVFAALLSLGNLTAYAQAQCPNPTGCPSTDKFVSLNRYRIQFLGVTCSGGNSTWCYSVTWNGNGSTLNLLAFSVGGGNPSMWMAAFSHLPATHTAQRLSKLRELYGVLQGRRIAGTGPGKHQ